MLALLAFAAALAFLLGYAVNQASTCAVTAAKLLLHDAQAGLTIGFGLAVGTAGLVTLPLAWLMGSTGHLAPWSEVSAGLLCGAMLLGLGAVINDACLFGTLSRIGEGELRFLALPLGLALGFVVVAQIPGLSSAPSRANPLAAAGPMGVAALVLFAVLAVWAWRALQRGATQRLHETAWPLGTTMVLFGLAGALLYALVPGWTYADAVRRAVGAGSAGMSSLAAALCAVSTLLGAVVSGLRSGRFHPGWPRLSGSARSLFGGMVMAFGAALVPGGNDSLLFAALPALSPGGVVAYLIMTATVLGLLAAIRRFSA